MSKAEKIKNLRNSFGIQYLLDEAYKILNNPLTVFDTDYKLIAYTDVPIDDYIWNQLITDGTFSIKTQMFFMNECFTDEVANAQKLALMKSDKLKYNRILGHIYNGNGIKVANVLMMEYKEAFDSDTIAAFEIFTDLVIDEIRNDEYYIRYGEMYQSNWIKRLIDYDIEEKGLYSPHVQILYNNFESNLYLAVADISRCESRHNGCQYFIDILRLKQKDFKYSIYDDYIVIIISTNCKSFNIKKELGIIGDYFVKNNIFAGVSSCFGNLFELRKYYYEAVKALESIKPNSGRHIVVYNRLILK